jgi:hypothetical protein
MASYSAWLPVDIGLMEYAYSKLDPRGEIITILIPPPYLHDEPLKNNVQGIVSTYLILGP